MRNRPSKNDLFKDRHFEQEIIVLCVRWYLRYKGSVALLSVNGLFRAERDPGLRWTDLSCQRVELV